MNLAHEKIITVAEARKQKIELISKILNYPSNRNLPLEKQVSTFDQLYELPLEELTIYSKIYK